MTSTKVPGQAANAEQGESEPELSQHERERVIELMLSQERVISLLYDKTFHMTQVGAENGSQQATQQDIDFLKRQQQEMA